MDNTNEKQVDGLEREYEDAVTREKVRLDRERSKVNDFSEYYGSLVEWP